VTVDDVGRLADAVAERLRAERDDRPLLTPKAAAARLAISERTLREMRNRGRIDSVMVEGAVRYEAAEIDRYLAAQRER
jgi:excisionase family DNA binding protein